ncbi:MAG: DUF2334 domain-containing protein [Mycobacteriales bacterium]
MTGGPRRHRLPAGVRLLALVALVVAVVVGGGATAERYVHGRPIVGSAAAAPVSGPARYATLKAPPGAPGPGGDPARRTLVLYAEGEASPGPAQQMGHQSAIQAANLASRGGSWVMRPVERYRPGGLTGFDALIYLGTQEGTPPPAFLADVARQVRAGSVRILWMGSDLEQLLGSDPSLSRRLGWSVDGSDRAHVVAVEYGRRRLTRQADDDEMVRISVTDGRSAHVLGRAVHADGSKSPWAVRSGNLTFIGEIPFDYTSPGDRYLAAADLVLRTVAPDAPDRHRALIRIEDVGPHTEPRDIRGIADFLAGRGIPFTLAVYPYYRDPHGAANQGRPTAYGLVDRPKLVAALKYATQRGGVIIMHGVTHQYGDLRNPYSGTSADDYEFYRAHVDARNDVQLDGPVPHDSEDWAVRRISAGRGEFVHVGLADPGIFEFPHYAGSAADYRAVQKVFGVRYDEGTYFDGLCPRGNCADHGAPAGEMSSQYFPYPVRDVYGSIVIPENLLNISAAFNNNPPRTAADVVAAAEALRVVRDGVASAFFHPYLGIEQLAQIVDGIRALGYTYISPEELLRESGPGP